MHRYLVLAALLALAPAACPLAVWAPAAWAQTKKSEASEKKPVVAVFTMEAKGVALAPSALDRLSDYLATRLAATGRYQVIPRADLKTRLAAQKKVSYRVCYDSACQIEIGKELAAEKSLSSAIIRLGSRCAMTATIYDLRRAATEGAATARAACNEEALAGAIDVVAASLAGARPAKVAPDLPPAVPPKHAASTSPVPSTPAPTVRALRERTEWLTVTVLPGLINGPSGALAIAGGALGAFTLKWQLFGRFYLAWTPLEVVFTHAVDEDKVLLGTLSTVGGLAIFFGHGASHQLRLLLSLGGGAAGDAAGFIPAGEAEYRYQTAGRFFFGVGGRLVLPTFTSTDSTRGSYYPVAAFLALRFGWAATP